jgi:ATP-dependent Lon protease
MIILCHENKSDIDEIKPEYIQGLTFHYVKEMSDVLKMRLQTRRLKCQNTVSKIVLLNN